MITLDLGKYRRARVWLGELPDVDYHSVKTLTRTIAVGRNSQNGLLRLAAIEVNVPLGPRTMYGLLGGKFDSDATDELRVDVSVSSANDRAFTDSLAGKSDEVRVGLPAEYAEAVLAGVNLAKAELNAVTGGTLFINRAAHGSVGSCQVVYKHLAAILVKLFNGTNPHPSDAELVKLFPQTFS